MIIGIDGNEANVDVKVGIGEYAYQLIVGMADLITQEERSSLQIYLKNLPNSTLPKKREKLTYSIVGPSRLWTQVGLPLNLYIQYPRPDVFFSPTHYAPRFAPCPTVVSVMDLSYLFFPELFRKDDLYQLTNWTKYSVEGAKKIITISKSSKNDIIKKYGIQSDKIEVVYPGIKALSMKEKDWKEIVKTYSLPEKYILFVGTLQPRKNIAKLIEAMSLVQDAQKDLHLVVVGKKGWLYEEILKAPEKFKISEKVHFLDFVTDEDLPHLYTHAECFVLPSLYEGFGLPVLEAMQHGCPVITSNISSLPEAGGDAALYIDPKSAKDIAEKIDQVLSDKKLRESMVSKGYEQVKKFNWEKSAQQVLDILKNVAKS
jgi:glycosyltransferase involved in cell wall biosynthesis